MILKEGNISIINPKDEEPHIDVESQRMVHFQHGNTKRTGNDISISFIFRVSQHSCICNCSDNKVIVPDDVMENINHKEYNQQ